MRVAVRPQPVGRAGLLPCSMLTALRKNMHKVLEDSKQLLLSLSAVELAALTQLVEAASGVAGAGAGMAELLSALKADVHESRREHEVTQAWEDQGVVMVRVMNTFGDPVELNEDEARAFTQRLQRAIADAESA